MQYEKRWVKFNGITIGRNSPYLLTDIQGLSDGTVTRQETQYIKTDGAKISEVYYNMRPFTITGHILTDSPDIAERRARKLTAVCAPKKPFQLEYFNGIHKFSAECCTNELPIIVAINNRNFKFSISITNPGFYWHDVKVSHKNINAKEDLVSGSFILPMVFTRMYFSAEVKNLGDVETEPIITVTALADSGEQVVTVLNETTGQSIGINHQLANGEVITFDHVEGDITSSISGNIINKLIKTSDFWALEPGANLISSPNTNVQINIQHRNRYLGVGR